MKKSNKALITKLVFMLLLVMSSGGLISVYANTVPIINENQIIQTIESLDNNDITVIVPPWGFPQGSSTPVITEPVVVTPAPIIPIFDEPVSRFVGQDIVSQNHPETVVSGIFNLEGYNIFAIETTSPITDIEHFTLYNNRLVIDILNSVPKSDTVFDGLESLVERVRMARQDGFSRIVFDMYAVPNYSFSLSYDRTRLYINFESTVITDFSTFTTDYNDYIVITASDIPAFNISQIFQDVLIVDLPLSSLAHQFPFNYDQNFNFITDVSIQQINSSMARITVVTTDMVSYKYFAGNNILTIQLAPPTFQNIEFDRIPSTITLLNDDKTILQLNNITIEHYYRDLKHTFILNQDLSDHFGYGIVPFNSDYTSIVEIVTENGITKIIAHGPNIAYVELIQIENGVTIRTFSPREVYDFIVVLDPGHGGTDPGAVHFGFRESDLVLEIGNMLYYWLGQRENIGVFTTRTTDVFVPLAERAGLANNVADLFVSIHLNAFSTGTPHGTETYWLAHPEEYRWPLSREEVAAIFHNNLLDDLGRFDRGIRTANFAVLRLTNMPSVLLEYGFMSNYAEMQFFANPTNLHLTASSTYRSIIEIYELTR